MRGSAASCGSARRIPDTRLGPGAVTAKISESGMGDVYRVVRSSWRKKSGVPWPDPMSLQRGAAGDGFEEPKRERTAT